jgi:hypothetical protein
MNRTSLVEAVQEIATQKGYTFCPTSAEGLPAHASKLPTLVMIQPKMLRIEGRKHGKITYNLTLHLLHRGATLPPDEQTALLNRAEDDAIDTLTILSTHPQVIAIENLQTSASTSRLSHHGDVTITATAEVVCHF